MTGAALQSHYAAVRARLCNPSIVGRDTEIDLGRQSAAARAAREEIVAREQEERAIPERKPPKPATTFWTDDRVAELKRRWETKATTRQIAEAMGAKSKNSIISKAAHLKLKPRNPPRVRAEQAKFDLSRCGALECVDGIIGIQRTVAAAHGITRIDLTSHRRGARLVKPRHMAMYLCAVLTPHSFPNIGRLFHRDHTTVIYARDKIAKLRATDEKLNSEIEALIARLGMSEAA